MDSFQTQASRLALTIGPAPKDPSENAIWRTWVRSSGDASPLWAEAFRIRGKNDCVWWIDTWGWTQNSKDFPDDPHQPIILWPKQEEFVRWVVAHIKRGISGLVEKSREQGATVIMSQVWIWQWDTQKNGNLGLGSRTMDMVDGDSVADQIMPKMDYTLDAMPKWALFSSYEKKKPFRKRMQIFDPASGKVIKGHTANKHMAVGGRPAAFWGDEIAKWSHQDSIHKAISNATNCFIYTTTPEGYELFARLVQGGNIDVFRLHWTDNPLWQEGRYVCQPGCKAHEDGGAPHSKRYDNECAKLNWNKKVIAQELDIDYHKSGGAVFPEDVVRRVIQTLTDNEPETKSYHLHWITNGEEPAISVDPDCWYKASKKWDIQPEQVMSGPFRVWQLPNPKHLYVVGGDCSKGLEHGDYSCFPVWDVTVGKMVAEWHGRASPQDAGRIAGAICRFYGTASGCQKNAWGGVEHNENGLTVNDILDRMGILLHKSSTETSKRTGSRSLLGVYIPPRHKRRMIDKYLLPMMEAVTPEGLPALVDPFIEFWRECETFVEYDPAGGKLNSESVKMGAMKHQFDDRVMARLSLFVAAFDRFGKVCGIEPELTGPMDRPKEMAA